MNFKKWHLAGFVSIAFLLLSIYLLPQILLGSQVAGFQVVKGPLMQTVLINGKIETVAPIDIYSKLGGKLVAIHIVDGESVKAGQNLFTIENKKNVKAIENARLKTIRAEKKFRNISELTQSGSELSLKRAKNALDTAMVQYKHSMDLARKGYINHDQSNDALQSLTIAQRQLSTAQFQAKASRASGSEYALAALALSHARSKELGLREQSIGSLIKAESDGKLIPLSMKKGDVILPGQKLATLLPEGLMRLNAELDIKDIDQLKVGQKALFKDEIKPEQANKIEIGKISIASLSAPNQINLEFIHVRDSTQPNMMVTLDVEVAERLDVLSVSADAIRFRDNGEPWVMALVNGYAQRKFVKLGVRGYNRIEVLEGLEQGDWVLPASVMDKLEGKRIRLANNG